jgi:hypothetical protein
LRTELGYLIVEDPNKVHAVRGRFIETVEPHTWRWRVYLPPRGTYSLNVFSGHLHDDISRPKLAELQAAKRQRRGSLRSRKLEPGEFTLDVRLVNGDEGWTLETRPGGTNSIPDSIGSWMNYSLTRQSELTAIFKVGQKQKSFEPDVPILLMYISKPDFSEDDSGRPHIRIPNGNVDGIVIWLEPEPPSTPVEAHRQ